MVYLGRKVIHKEFVNQQCQILHREQHPVAFGLLVSFLFSLLPIEDEDLKKRGHRKYQPTTVISLATEAQVHRGRA